MFDHEKLDVYQLSLGFTTWAYELSKEFTGTDRHARDQLIRASQSIPLNIAEGNGKRSIVDRKRFFQIARGSALECAAIIDVVVRTKVIDSESADNGKKLLKRIVAMLTKLTDIDGSIGECVGSYTISDEAIQDRSD